MRRRAARSTTPAPSARCAASRAGTRPTPRRAARPLIDRARRAGDRPPSLADAAPPLAGRGRDGARRRVARSPPPAAAPPTSPAPSTPRAASCSSCATAWRSSACARSPSTSPPRASRRPRCVHPREVARHHPERRARRVHRRPRLARSPRWRSPSSTSSRARRDLGGLISAGGSGGTALATAGMRALPIGVPEGDGVDRGLGRRRGPTSARPTSA